MRQIKHYILSLCLLIHITRPLRPLDGMTKDVLRKTTKVNGSDRTEYNKLLCLSFKIPTYLYT